MIDLYLIQTPAMLLGLAGGVLTVSRTRRNRAAGYGSWIIGNSLWTISGVITGNLNIICQFAFFAVLAIQGIKINRGGDPDV